MLARWLPLAQGYGRVACRTSKARASRAAWSPSPAHARSRSVRAHAAGGWRISDSLGSGGGGSGGSDERPPGDEGSFRDGTREGREREGRGRARAPSRGYDARPRDAYDSHARGRSRGGRDDLRHHDPGFSSRDSSRDSSSSSREFGGRGRAGRPAEPAEEAEEAEEVRAGARPRGPGRTRARRARVVQGRLPRRIVLRRKRGGDGRRDERDERRGGSDFSAAAFAGDASHASHDRPNHSTTPTPRSATIPARTTGTAARAARTTSRGATRVSGAAPRGRRRDGPSGHRTARLATRETRGSCARRAFGHARRSLKTIRSNGGGTRRRRRPAGRVPRGCRLGRVGRRIGTRADPGGLLPVLRDVPPRAGRGGRRRAARVPDRGAGRPRGRLGVYFVGTKKTGVRQRVAAQRCSRAGRAAARVAGQLRAGGAAVYDFVRYAVPWPEVVPERTGHVLVREPRVELHGRHLDASGGDRAKDAVCDALVDANGWRPPPRAATPRRTCPCSCRCTGMRRRCTETCPARACTGAGTATRRSTAPRSTRARRRACSRWRAGRTRATRRDGRPARIHKTSTRFPCWWTPCAARERS